MPKGLQPKGLMRRNKMLLAAVKLFLKDGYEKTTTAAIAKVAGMAPSSFFAAFENKEALLLTLVQRMFDNHDAATKSLVQEDDNPLMFYAVETSLQLYITELSEEIREVYTVAYSLPTTQEYIYTTVSKKWMPAFEKYIPEADLKDFYEISISTAGILRGFMAKKCDLYFTMEQKIRRFLYCSLSVYHVPEKQQKKITERILGMNLHAIAKEIIIRTVEDAEKGFENVMTGETL